MCVTSAPADMSGTMALTYVTSHQDGGQPVHVTAYQNKAKNLVPGPNCMLLHFPSQGDLELVDGPDRTYRFMEDVTRGLPSVVDVPMFRGGETRGIRPRVQTYGDYTVVLAHNTRAIPDVLSEVEASRRPVINNQFERLLAWYDANYPDYGFALCCFNGTVEPRHPVMVSYVPHNDDVLFVPGIDAHDGNLPPADQVERNFKVAFAVQSLRLPREVIYQDGVSKQAWWAPHTVTGFHDNRPLGANRDYVVPLADLEEGLAGTELIQDLIL